MFNNIKKNMNMRNKAETIKMEVWGKKMQYQK